MTIDEAIAHAREVAEGCRAENGDCAYQHDKLTEWLVELKAYRETGLKPEEIADFREMYREMAAKFADYKAAEVTGHWWFFRAGLRIRCIISKPYTRGGSTPGEGLFQHRLTM